MNNVNQKNIRYITDTNTNNREGWTSKTAGKKEPCKKCDKLTRIRNLNSEFSSSNLAKETEFDSTMLL